MSQEDEQLSRVRYCKERNIHHLFELLATKVLLDKPEDHFQYLRELLTSVEESEKNKKVHDPTKLREDDDEDEEGKKAEKKKSVTLAMLGIDNAGKTTLLSNMGGNVDTDTTPTVGFTPVHFATPTTQLCVFDLGGARNFRGIWVHYLHDCHGLIFVIDSSDADRLEESLEALKTIIAHPYLKGKPVLVVANKKDLPSSRGVDIVSEDFFDEALEKNTPHRVVATCALEQNDSSIDNGVEWILQHVLMQYTQLLERVQNDTIHMREEKKRKIAERMAALAASTD